MGLSGSVSSQAYLWNSALHFPSPACLRPWVWRCLWSEGSWGGLAFLVVLIAGMGAAVVMVDWSGTWFESGTMETAAGRGRLWPLVYCLLVFQAPKRKRLNWRWVFGLSCMCVVGVMAS